MVGDFFAETEKVKEKEVIVVCKSPDGEDGPGGLFLKSVSVSRAFFSTGSNIAGDKYSLEFVKLKAVPPASRTKVEIGSEAGISTKPFRLKFTVGGDRPISPTQLHSGDWIKFFEVGCVFIFN
jgi:hypothetical protein